MSTAARFLGFFFTWQFLVFSVVAVVSTIVVATASGMYRNPARGWQTGLISGLAFGLGALAAFSTM